MDILQRVDVNLFSMAVALILGLSLRRRSEKPFLDYQLFMLMLSVTVFELATDTAMWVFEDSRSALGRAVLYSSGFLYYLGHPAAPLAYAVYVMNQIEGDSLKLRFWLPILVLPAALSTALCVATPFTGWFFLMEPLYRHGPLFGLFAGLSYSYFLFTFGFVAAYWKRADRRTLIGLLVAPFLPTAASVLQVSFYGLVLIWPATVLSLLVIYVNIQQRKLSLDYLTGAYNRRRLDEYVEARAREAREPRAARPRAMLRKGSGRPKGFAGFLADLDDFKAINDRLGHAVGDKALVAAVELLRSCLRSEDFLARYAGDEFVAVLPLSSEAELVQVVRRVRTRLEERAARGGDYRISLSIGAAVFDPGIDESGDKFVERLDGLMYREKQGKKASRSGGSRPESPDRSGRP